MPDHNQTTRRMPKGIEAEISAVVQRVLEYDDRTSPEDWPEAMLITPDELTEELRQFACDLLMRIAQEQADHEQYQSTVSA